jgi:hypothetical protein
MPFSTLILNEIEQEECVVKYVRITVLTNKCQCLLHWHKSDEIHLAINALYSGKIYFIGGKTRNGKWIALRGCVLNSDKLVHYKTLRKGMGAVVRYRFCFKIIKLVYLSYLETHNSLHLSLSHMFVKSYEKIKKHVWMCIRVAGPFYDSFVVVSYTIR